MTEGVSKGLFIVVAVVIFGIFVFMADNILGLNLTNGLVGLFTQATEQVEKGPIGSDPVIPNPEVPNEETQWEVDKNDADLITFEDKALADLVSEQLGVSSDKITFGSLKNLTNLQVPTHIVIESFKGLEYAVNLKDLGIEGDSFTDVNKLGVLPVDTVVSSQYLIKNEDVYVKTNFTATSPIFIRDIFLRSIIRKELNIQAPKPITYTDIIKLKSLDINNKGIIYLHGLDNAINLEFIDASHNYISSLTSTKYLTKLTTLDVSYNALFSFDLNQSYIDRIPNLNIKYNRQ